MEEPLTLGRSARRPAARPLPAATSGAPGRIPPHALELEQAALGAVMLEKDALARVLDSLKPEIFYKDAHRYIAEACMALFQRQEPVDLLTVTEALRKAGKLDAAGGPLYLVELTTRVASAANLEHHCHLLTQYYIRRELIARSGQWQAGAYTDTEDVFDLLDKAEQSLYDLSGNNLRREAQSISRAAVGVIRNIEELRGKGDGVTGVRTGFRRLDDLTAGWQRSDLIILAARPSMGKTAFVLSIARNAAMIDKKAVAFFSLEMSAGQLVQRMLSSEAEIDAGKLRTGKLEDHEWVQLNARIGELTQAPIYIDDTPALSVMELRAKCRRLKSERNIEMIIIDYLQLMSAGSPGKNTNREQEIATISRSLKQLAKELDVPVIALSQLSRAVETRGGDKRPMLSDLRESGSIEQDADLVAFLYRPEYYGLTTDEEGNPTQGICEIIIGKQRNGPVDTVKLQFVSRFAKFLNLEADVAAPPRFRPGPTGGAPVTLPSRGNDMPDEDLGDDPFAAPF